MYLKIFRSNWFKIESLYSLIKRNDYSYTPKIFNTVRKKCNYRCVVLWNFFPIAKFLNKSVPQSNSTRDHIYKN